MLYSRLSNWNEAKAPGGIQFDQVEKHFKQRNTNLLMKRSTQKATKDSNFHRDYIYEANAKFPSFLNLFIHIFVVFIDSTVPAITLFVFIIKFSVAFTAPRFPFSLHNLRFICAVESMRTLPIVCRRTASNWTQTV